MIFNLGSINADHFYRVPHLPTPGETLVAQDFTTGLGGKGANQSVAAAQAGSKVTHIGSVGPDGIWTVDALKRFGVDVNHVMQVDVPTAHAIINIDENGENAIVIFPGANLNQSLTQLETALDAAKRGDTLLLQNETNLQAEAAQMARERGLFIVYSAAPFSSEAVKAVAPFVDLLVMNDIEAKQLMTSLRASLQDLPISRVLVTHGAAGADWIQDDSTQHCPAFPVDPIDTTGAGDCFVGFVAAGLDQGMSPSVAMQLGAAASALQVQKAGTADAIPSRTQVDAFLDQSE